VTAPVDGVVSEVRVSPGDQVDTGQVLAVVDDGCAES
jgi:biotin carboxyl carrier protein